MSAPIFGLAYVVPRQHGSPFHGSGSCARRSLTADLVRGWYRFPEARNTLQQPKYLTRASALGVNSTKIPALVVSIGNELEIPQSPLHICRGKACFARYLHQLSPR